MSTVKLFLCWTGEKDSIEGILALGGDGAKKCKSKAPAEAVAGAEGN